LWELCAYVLHFSRTLFFSPGCSTAAMLITSTSDYETTYLVGSQKSIVLYVAIAAAGFTSASSNVFFYPVMAQYPRRYIAAYTFGLSLSSTSTGVAALIQDGPNSLYISPSAYFAFFHHRCSAVDVLLRVSCQQPDPLVRANTRCGNTTVIADQCFPCDIFQYRLPTNTRSNNYECFEVHM